MDEPHELWRRSRCFGHRFTWVLWGLSLLFGLPVGKSLPALPSPPCLSDSTLTWRVTPHQGLVLGMFCRVTRFVTPKHSAARCYFLVHGFAGAQETEWLFQGHVCWFRWQWLLLGCCRLGTRTRWLHHQSRPSRTESKDSFHWWAAVTFGLFSHRAGYQL